jgi:hypothetical protein
MLAFTLVMAFGAIVYTMRISSVVDDIGVVKELEKIQYNQQLYLGLVSHIDSIQQARMDTATRNRADYIRIQRRTDSIIAYETKIRAAQVEELRKKGLWE